MNSLDASLTNCMAVSEIILKRRVTLGYFYRIFYKSIGCDPSLEHSQDMLMRGPMTQRMFL